MNPETEKALAFYGKMTANLTHEVKNILAIIQESAGLMEDILAISPLADQKYQEKFNNSMATIKSQLHRGMDLTTRFNRFAHLPDQTSAEVDLGEAVDHFRTLTERLARLKQVALEKSSASGDQIKLKTNPVLLFMAMFYSLESCLEVLPAKSTITVESTQRHGSPSFEIACAGEQTDRTRDLLQGIQETRAWGELRDAAAGLEASVEFKSGDSGFSLVF